MEKMIPLFKVKMSKNASDKVAEVLNSGFIGQGPKVDEFEDKLKKWLGSDLVSTTNSATAAEHLALHLLKKPADHFGEGYWPGLNRGDEVLTGYKEHTYLPAEEQFSFYHPKTIDRQEKQNNFYNTI